MTTERDTMTETPEARLKRMRMRSWRRGIREMDMILGPYSDTETAKLTEAELGLYDLILEENDHDLYQWVSGAAPTPPEYLDLMSKISVHARANNAKHL